GDVDAEHIRDSHLDRLLLVTLETLHFHQNAVKPRKQIAGIVITLRIPGHLDDDTRPDIDYPNIGAWNHRVSRINDPAGDAPIRALSEQPGESGKINDNLAEAHEATPTNRPGGRF